MDEDLIPLADAISALRLQLQRALEEGANEALRFEVGPVEVEFQGVVEREANAEGQVGFKIFGLGASAGGKLSDARTQTIKITLTPKLGGRLIDVGDREEIPGLGG